MPLTDAEVLAKVRQTLEVPDLTNDELPLALSRWADDLEEKAEKAAKELKTAKDEVTRLSRGANKADPAPDELSLSLYGRSLRTEKTAAIKSGKFTDAGFEALDEIFLTDGKPNGLALSRAGGEPLYSRVIEVINQHGTGGVAHGTAEDRIAASRTAAGGNPLDLKPTGNQPSDADLKPEIDDAVAWKNDQLRARGHAVN